ncbi:ROK family protein [Thomasclavelia sp.]|uniref:ROK family protein n=1 Tax=Thomasclavelia sp. TaxID=3025757 RepID=UPI0025E30EF3|nr:ROK family protein [Thomasclavelia sp.]
MVYKSEDIKKLNSLVLLKKLYQVKDATMAELVKTTQFSQSSVRSILKDLETKKILVLKNIDQSSGGRCPARYTFSKEYFQILSVFIDEGTVEIMLKDIFNQEIFSKHLVCKLNAELENIIIQIINECQVNCISIASSGVIQDDCFYTDQGDYMTKHEIAVNLKKQTKIPIIIENDVKSMMMGIQANQEYDQLAYLYMSETGVGSAYYLQGKILKGNQSFSGELGLLPHGKQTINEVIASKPGEDELEDIYAKLLVTIAVTIDPQRIILAGKNIDHISIENIINKMHKCLSLKYQINIDISTQPLIDGLNGLHYLGILKLFDLYTDYQRGK